MDWTDSCIYFSPTFTDLKKINNKKERTTPSLCSSTHSQPNPQLIVHLNINQLLPETSLLSCFSNIKRIEEENIILTHNIQYTGRPVTIWYEAGIQSCSESKWCSSHYCATMMFEEDFIALSTGNVHFWMMKNMHNESTSSYFFYLIQLLLLCHHQR